ncbi:MAG TPA: RNA polymerase sigma factor [Planctomycetota bacterium]|nr:RNA polymerase sigma factor [Planctomycetota bacterium]
MPDDTPETGALSQSFEQHRGDLLRQAQAIVGSVEDAEDVVQETYCDALRDPEKLSHADSAGAWLRSLNRCNALNRLRDRQSLNARHDSKRQLAPDRAFTTGGFSLLELRDAVNKAVGTLSPEHRRVVELRFFQHRSYKEIAADLNIPVGNIGGMLMDALVHLHPKLQSQLDPRNSVSTSRHTKSSLPVENGSDQKEAAQ